MIDARFKAKTQTAWHAGVAGFIPHRGTTLSCIFIADIKSYRLSRGIHNARTNSTAIDIQEKVKMDGKNTRKIKDLERKVQKKETSHTT